MLFINQLFIYCPQRLLPAGNESDRRVAGRDICWSIHCAGVEPVSSLIDCSVGPKVARVRNRCAAAGLSGVVAKLLSSAAPSSGGGISVACAGVSAPTSELASGVLPPPPQAVIKKRLARQMAGIAIGELNFIIVVFIVIPDTGVMSVRGLNGQRQKQLTIAVENTLFYFFK